MGRHSRTRTDCGVRREALGLGQRDDGRPMPRMPRRVSVCTVNTRTKSAALRPPRNRPAPPVGST